MALGIWRRKIKINTIRKIKKEKNPGKYTMEIPKDTQVQLLKEGQ